MKDYPLTYIEYKQGLSENRLLGLKCTDCGSITSPPNGVCGSCGNPRMEVETLVAKGCIRTFTVIRVAPQGFNPPYIVAMVELEDGPWVMGNVIGIDPETADMNLMDREVTVGHRIIPQLEDDEGGVEGVTLTFSLTG